MSKKVNWSIGIVAGVALFALMAVPSAQAVTATASLSDVSLSSSTAGATGVTLTATMVVNSAIPANSNLSFAFMGNAPHDQGFNFSNASLSFSPATSVTLSPDNMDRLNLMLNSQLSAGTKTVTITGVQNATQSGLFTLGVEIGQPGIPGLGEEITASAPTAVGAIAVMGRVKLPSGEVVSGEGGVGVNLRTENFDRNFGTGVDNNGWYAFPVSSFDGTITNGTYFLEAWPGNLQGYVSPDPVSVTYSGSIITKNITLVAAKKTVNVTVKYNTGGAVTTAEIWANKRDGGGHMNSMVDSTGKAALTVSGGSYEVGVNCGWDPEANSQMDCDWSNSQPPVNIQFANDSTVETKSLTITVQKTNAKIIGTVKLPNGTPLLGGFIDVRAGEQGGGMGASINSQDGSFTINVTAGDYKLMVFPDEHQNPDMAKYYTGEIQVRVSINETKVLAITMKQKTSKITGKVTDKSGTGVSGVWMNTWKRNGEGWANARSGAGGTFSMWVSAGEWEIQVDTHRPPEPGEISSYIPVDGRPVSVNISDNQTVTGVTFRVQLADATVNVKIVDSGGGAMTDFWGYAWCRKAGAGFGPGSEFGSGIDRGTATIPLLGGQTYTCGTHLPPEVEVSLESEVEVTVPVNGTKDVKLTLIPNNSAIIGWVKDQNGQIVKNVEGEVFAIEFGNWGGWHPGRLNADGSYRISLLGGEGKKYMVGVHFWSKEQSDYMETHPEPDSAIVVPADTEVVKVVQVFKTDTSISGTVYTPDGTPMPHVWVDAGNWKQMEGKVEGDFVGGKEIHAGTETRSDGKFTINIVSGEYTIHSGLPPEFQGDLMSPREIDVTVTANAPATGIQLYYRQADAFITATGKFEGGSSPEFGFCHAWSENGGHSGKEMFGGSARIPLTTGTWWVGCDTFSPNDGKFYRSDEQQISVVKGDDKSASFTLIEAAFDIPESFTQTFTATQQNVFNLPGGTIVTIPANAAGSDDSTYTIIATPNTNLFFTNDSKPLTFAWDFEITKQSDSGTELVETFNSNVTIAMPIPIEYITELGLTVNDIFGKYWDVNSGTWKLPDSAIISYDESTGEAYASIQVSHFTEFALTTGATFGAAASSTGPQYVVATPISGGGPQVTVWDADGNAKLNFFAYSSDLRIGIQAVAGDIDGDGTNEIIVAPGAGAGPQVRIFDLNGNVIDQFFAFASHVRTGVKIDVADVDGDGNDEIIVTTMAGAGPQIRVFDGNGNVEQQFFAYAETFRGGVNMTTGDVDGDGVPEIVVVPESDAGPQVRVLDYDGTVVSQFFAYADTVRGGYHVTTGDVDADGTADVVVTPGPGLGPQVAMFTGTGELIDRFFAFAETFRGGLNVSIGDVNSDGANEVVATPESGAGPQVRVFDTSGNPISQYWAYAETLRGNFISVVADVNQDGTMDIVTAPGAGMGPQVRVFDNNGYPLSQYFTHHTGFRGGINISTVPIF